MRDVPANASYIGWWLNRLGQKWHLVETEITDRLVTRCGRQMKLETRDGYLQFDQQPQGRVCLFCASRKPVV